MLSVPVSLIVVLRWRNSTLVTDGFSTNLTGWLVLANRNKCGMAELVIMSPFAERYLNNDLRLQSA
jgi:hypothetical protein